MPAGLSVEGRFLCDACGPHRAWLKNYYPSLHAGSPFTQAREGLGKTFRLCLLLVGRPCVELWIPAYQEDRTFLSRALGVQRGQTSEAAAHLGGANDVVDGATLAAGLELPAPQVPREGHGVANASSQAR